MWVVVPCSSGASGRIESPLLQWIDSVSFLFDTERFSHPSIIERQLSCRTNTFLVEKLFRNRFSFLIQFEYFKRIKVFQATFCVALLLLKTNNRRCLVWQWTKRRPFKFLQINVNWGGKWNDDDVERNFFLKNNLELWSWRKKFN